MSIQNTINIDLVRSLGADHVVDYTTTDFVRSKQRYDLIFDTVGNRSVPDLRRALAEGGTAAVTGYTNLAEAMGPKLRGGKISPRCRRDVTTKDLDSFRS
jgi:NADPH:quinone reductase-like Zn-dependent oxidoreductase